jgi:hypothetical protein
MQATARMASVVSATLPARRRLIRDVRPRATLRHMRSDQIQLTFERHLCLALAFLCLNSCSSMQGIHPSPLGDYALAGEGWLAGEYLTLRSDHFEYAYFTDVVGVSPNQGGEFKATGTYEVDGCLLILHHKSIRNPYRILTHHRHGIVIWTPKQYDEFLSTKKMPKDVLHHVTTPGCRSRTNCCSQRRLALSAPLTRTTSVDRCG